MALLVHAAGWHPAKVISGDEERCLDAGMDGYISKPISADKLFMAIERFTG